MEISYLSRFNSLLHKISEWKYTVFLLLVLGFIIRILLYINTTQFDNISESGSVLGGFERLKQDEIVYLVQGNYRYILSYVIYFFYKLFGSIHWFFIFQSIIASITLYVVYILILDVSSNKVSAIIGLFLATFYIDFALLPSVAYYQTFEIFFTSLVMLMVLKLITISSLRKYFIIAFLLILIIFSSLLFRGTLKYYHLILPISGIYLYLNNNINKNIAYRLAIISLISIAFFNILSSSYFFKTSDKLPTNSNIFVFFGHTDYGGHGGEGSFIYEENRIRYEKALKNYLKINNIDNPTWEDINAFQMQEVKKFIFNKPHSWVFLQIKKIVYTYSSVPIRDTLNLLMTGHVRFGLIFSSP